MATKQARGTKRTCQNGECGSRFYDLNKNPIVCPVCGSIYEIASAPFTAPAVVAEEKVVRKPKKPEFVAPTEDAETPEAESEEQIGDIETEEPIAAEEDETFLEEEEEDGGDMSNIIGGPVAEDDEER